jgi:reactive intermediate/imine deaminase
MVSGTVALLLAAAPAAAQRQAPDVRYLNSPDAERLGLPFSQAVRVGDILYLSGQIGIRPGSLELAAGGIEAEARQTMDNIRAILEANGSSLDRVVKCTVFLADMQEWQRFNAVYVTYFPRNKPARSALGANGLALGARVEVECIAVASSG